MGSRSRRDSVWRQGFWALGVVALLAGPARADEPYPTRPVRLVVAYGAGGAIDVVARIVAEGMATTLGKPVVIENKPGASGTIAADLVAHSPADGYTLLVTGTAHAVMKVLQPDATVDAKRDFLPVSHLGNMPFVLAVNPQFQAKDFPGFLAYLKANPGKANFGSAGPGSSSDLAVLLFAKMTGLDFVRVQYRSTPAAMNDLVAGQITFMLDSQNVLAPQVQAGALRGLAIGTNQRSRLLPDLKTLDELGLTGFDASSWQAMLAPAKTPPAIIERLTTAVAAAVADPGVQKKYVELGYNLPPKVGPAALDAFLARETEKWAPLAKGDS